MGALQYVTVPHYSAIIFRRSYRDLALPGALMDRSKEWLMPTDAQFKGQDNTWVFPSGAKLAFGYLDTDADKYRYQSAEFQYIGFDELTQFEEDKYRYLFSRLRRLTNSHIPLRMRSASNPGGIGHEWVKQRFMIEGYDYNRIFVPAKLQDNKHIDQQSYIKSLNNLDPITRRQYLEGDWSARHGGSVFKRESFKIIQEPPAYLERLIRYWDMAATKPKPDRKSDPDYTVGALLGTQGGRIYVLDIQRRREAPQDIEALIRNTAAIDHSLYGHKVTVCMEQEPGSSGVAQTNYYQREVLAGYTFKAVKSTGSKAERAGPYSSAVDVGNVSVLQAVWNSAYFDELEAFPMGSHDDQVDASSGAYSQLKGPQANPSFLLL